MNLERKRKKVAPPVSNQQSDQNNIFENIRINNFTHQKRTVFVKMGPSKINLEKLNEEMSMSSMDLASARTLILAFLTNSDDDATGKF